jgi:hypothetical protein
LAHANVYCIFCGLELLYPFEKKIPIVKKETT